MKRDIYQEITDQVIAKLEAGNNGSWRKTWACFTDHGLPTRANGEHYKGINLFILMLSAKSTRHWMTFKQAKELGGCVRKGERSTTVIFYKQIEIQDKLTGEDKKIPIMRAYAVFNADQIDDLPAKFYPDPAAPQHNEPKIEAAERYLRNTGAIISHGGDRAFYRPGTDQIRLPEFDAFEDAAAYYGMALHELTHWTGAEKRCDRDIKNSFGSKDYAREELVAELGAAFICGALNIETEVRQDHIQYLESWLKVLKADNKAIFKAASLAQKAVDFLDGLQVQIEQAA